MRGKGKEHWLAALGISAAMLGMMAHPITAMAADGVQETAAVEEAGDTEGMDISADEALHEQDILLQTAEQTDVCLPEETVSTEAAGPDSDLHGEDSSEADSQSAAQTDAAELSCAQEQPDAADAQEQDPDLDTPETEQETVETETIAPSSETFEVDDEDKSEIEKELESAEADLTHEGVLAGRRGSAFRRTGQALTALKQEVSAATSEEKEIRKAKQATEQELAAAEDAAEGISEEDYNSAKDEVNTAKDAVREAGRAEKTAEKEYASAAAASEAADAELAEKTAAKEAAEDTLADAAAAQSAADVKTEEAKAAVTDAEAAKTAAAKEQQKKIAEGSLGFFESMAEDDDGAALAVKLLTADEYPLPIHSWARPQRDWTTYKSYTKLGADKDATSLENMKKIFKYLREGNSYREKGDNNFDAMNGLLVNNYLMAAAQMNANYSSNNIEHAREFNVGENLFWGDLSIFDPYADSTAGWYASEKPLYDKNPDDSRTGHYVNIMNNGYYMTGMAVTSSSTKYTNAVSQTFWNDMAYFKDTYGVSGGKVYTVDEYEELFNSYYNGIKNLTKKAAAVLTAAKDALTAAQSEQKKAASAVTSAEKTLAKASSSADEAAVKAEEAEAAAATAAEKKAAASAASGKANTKLQQVTEDNAAIINPYENFISAKEEDEKAGDRLEAASQQLQQAKERRADASAAVNGGTEKVLGNGSGMHCLASFFK